MSIEMKPIHFGDLMRRAMAEYRAKKTMFAVPAAAPEPLGVPVNLFGTQLEGVVGPAAGPHTQLAQNLISAYAAGARFFELKTVQKLWGEELGIQRPCIFVRDEGYNIEWSSELSPEQAAQEYIKGYLALKLLSREFGLGDPEGFVFNLSVGYDLAGIQSPSVDRFLEVMKDASRTVFFQQCLAEAMALPFEHLDAAYIQGISPRISNNVTLSTMHGCPPQEIETIAEYLMREKGLHTYIKCNPTLVGYDTARMLLNNQGFGDIQFDRAQFEQDMKLSDALPMLRRLLAVGEQLGLRFGVKLTNTFPVKIQNGELAGDTMYLSGKALMPLALTAARLLTEELGSALPMSYSGGAEEYNVANLFALGLYPITTATALMKPGGYKNLRKMAAACARVNHLEETCATCLHDFMDEIGLDERYFPKQPRKVPGQVPPFACGRCTTCMDVCPNRANYLVSGLKQKGIHLDGPCNDCGACESACPFGFRPYADKFVLYPDKATLQASERDGFAIIDGEYTVRYQGRLCSDAETLPQEVRELMDAVRDMDLVQ